MDKTFKQRLEILPIKNIEHPVGNTKYYAAVHVKSLIAQADEEYQELFDKYSNLNDSYEKEVIRSSKLESQIIDLKSKLQQQALPVVPECVGEIVELLKKNPETPWSKLYEALGEEGVTWLNEFQHNDERFGFGGLNSKLIILFHLAINGHTVEKPQLFEVKMPIVYWDDDASQLTTGFDFLRIDKETDEVDFVGFLSNTKKHTVHFTEQEIKSIDERYWQFAVPVEDGE